MDHKGFFGSGRKGVNMGRADSSFKERMSIAAKLAGNATELSRRTGISRRAIGTYLSGASDPTRERLVSIAKASGVSVEWLATGRGMNPEHEAQARVSTGTDVDCPLSPGLQDEVPVPYHTVQSDNFAASDLMGMASQAMLYMKAETLSQLNYTDIFNLRAVSIVGERVTPVGVGNTLLIDCGEGVMEQQEAGVYLFRKQGSLRVAIAYPYQSRYIRMISCPGEDVAEILDPSRTDLVVLGRVIWSCGKV